MCELCNSCWQPLILRSWKKASTWWAIFDPIHTFFFQRRLKKWRRKKQTMLRLGHVCDKYVRCSQLVHHSCDLISFGLNRSVTLKSTWHDNQRNMFIPKRTIHSMALYLTKCQMPRTGYSLGIFDIFVIIIIYQCDWIQIP